MQWSEWLTSATAAAALPFLPLGVVSEPRQPAGGCRGTRAEGLPAAILEALAGDPLTVSEVVQAVRECGRPCSLRAARAVLQRLVRNGAVFRHVGNWVRYCTCRVA